MQASLNILNIKQADMDIRYLFNNVKMGETEKRYIEGKIEKTKKLLSHYPENELKAEVEISMDKKGFFRVEMMIKTPHNLFRVEKVNDALMSAVDSAEEALVKQVRRDREKQQDLRKRK